MTRRYPNAPIGVALGPEQLSRQRLDGALVDDRVVRQERRQLAGHRLGSLYVEQVANALDRDLHAGAATVQQGISCRDGWAPPPRSASK